MITGRGIRHSFSDTLVLDGIDLDVPRGSTLGLIGPNGSGKTTLLRTLYRSLRPDAGEVELDRTRVADLSGHELARILAVVVQENGGDLPMTVRDLVLMGRIPHRGRFGVARPEDAHIAADALTRVGAMHLAGRVFSGLSGGEKQRVLIARALTQEPTHLLLDEPTNHLDVRYQHEVLDIVAGLDVTSIIVLHDLNLAALYCDRIVLLGEGRVVAAGTADEVLTAQVLEPVYHVRVRRVPVDDGFQLAFRPMGSTRTDRDTSPIHEGAA